ncbi:hypothetical protein [Bacteroides fragilis]|uniref:Uncharacterized protein n=1 Tax=Bacteroides fragilis TaxID=817 RepID=A0A853PSG2_BACFG|nr:hypothetical protein [Bacteroides fragilis]EYA39721.1 hypothetical protein M075_1593 [Bacteroides fragilis str. 20793-3]MCS2358901.1 hypothetical protein [Bacteroides fragilis]OCR29950.1 hypothetical protein AC094_30250 [Bacteroides fragilis]PJY66374.1 hypothetical protein CQW35_01695 [Bacteroides fragilis]
MEADKKTFIDIDTFISNIETLINQGISEITKGGQMFKVNSTWYIVYYDNNYGMNINLESGADRNNIDTYLYSAWNVGAHSEERNKTDKLFEKLHEIYVLHQLFNKTNIIKSLKKYADILERCTSFEKLSESTFVLHFNNIKYCFIRKERYNSVCNSVEQYIEVSKYGENHVPQLVYESDNIDSIQSLYSILNAVYYINKTETGNSIDYNLICALGLNNNQ